MVHILWCREAGTKSIELLLISLIMSLEWNNHFRSVKGSGPEYTEASSGAHYKVSPVYLYPTDSLLAQSIIPILAGRQVRRYWLRHTGLLMSSVIAKLIRWPFLNNTKYKNKLVLKPHMRTHTHTAMHTLKHPKKVCSHMLRVRLATITEVECRKAVHGKGKTGINDWLGGPVLWLEFIVAYLYRDRHCVRGWSFVYANGVSSFRNKRSVMGGPSLISFIFLGTLAVGRGLQIVLWKETRRKLVNKANNLHH